MKTQTATRFVIFATAVSSFALLASMQGCSSSDDSPTTPEEDSGNASSSSNSSSSSSSSSSGGTDASTDAKTDAKTDSGSDAGACLDNTRTVDGGSDGGAVPCPGGGVCNDICTAINIAFKADVADDLIKSLVPGTDCVATDADNLRQTIITKAKASSAKSCVDVSVTSWCASVPTAANCKGDPTFDANCAALTKGLTGGTTWGASGSGGRLVAYKCMNDQNDPGYPNCNACLLAVASGVLFTDK